MKEVPTIWTIGHSNLHFFNFAKQLLEHQIKVVVDVRSRPYSRYAPQFNRTALEMQLSRLGITYIFKGQNLGGKNENIDFEQNIQWLCEQAGKEENTAIMCTEKDYRKCHRYKVIGQKLLKSGIKIFHILHPSMVEKNS